MITPAQIPKPHVKPKWRASVGIMESVVAYNCRKYGMPRPVLAMPMWEGAGNQAIDLSGHGNQLNLQSTTSWVGDGLELNGSSDYAVIPTSVSLDALDDATFSMWIKTNSVVATNQTFLNPGYSATDRFQLKFADDYIRIYNDINDIGSGVNSVSCLSANTWYHIILTVSGTIWKVYLDGSEKISNDFGVDMSDLTDGYHINIGSNEWGATPWNQWVDGNTKNFSIYDVALSTVQRKFLQDDPYFMYRMPEELYGYAAAVGDTVTYTSDALFKKLGLTKTYTADALLKKQAIPITYSADALLKIQNLLKSYTSDLLIKLTDGDVTYSADVLLELDGITKTYSSDLLIAVRNTKAYTADALLKALGVSTSYTTDALLKLIDESKTYTADSLIKKVDAGIPYTSDALLKKEDVSVSYTTDLLIQEIDNILSYTADLIIQLVATRTYTADALLKKLDNVASYTADVIINAAGVGAVSYSADALFKLNNITKAYTADLLIMVTNTLSYTADALIKKTDASVNYSSDALFKGLGLTKTYTADSLLQKTNLMVGYSSDALLQKAFTAAYTSDSILKKEGATALYTADALLKKAVSLSYSADVIISSLVIGSRTYTADLLIDIVSAEYPARVFFIRKSGTPQTGLTPAIDCYNKVVDGSSGGTSPMVREIGCGHYKFHYDISEDIAVRVDTGDVTMTDEERYLDVGVISQYDDAIDRKLSDVESNIRGSDGDDLKTISDQIDLVPTSAVIASDVWDEILTGATHNIPTSAGRRVREIGAFAIHSGTAQAGNSHSITLAASANANDGVYNRNLIVLTDNTGVGQTRTIVDYDGTSKIVVVDRDWRVSPDATTAYQIVPDDTPLTVDHGVARGGTNRTITIRAYASSVDDAYLCNIVTIIAGKGRGQARLVGAYDGTSNVVTICGDDWVDIPDTTSVYVMMPYGVACAACIGDTALDQLGDAVWDEDLTGHTTSKSAGWFVKKIKAIADAILAMVT